MLTVTGRLSSYASCLFGRALPIMYQSYLTCMRCAKSEAVSVEAIIHDALGIIANATEEARLIQCILSSCLET